MKLPQGERANISRGKVVEYLLSETHRAGKSKAIFFRASGFRIEKWYELADRLKQHSLDHEVAHSEETTFGIRFVIEGPLLAPNGRILQIRSIWFLDKNGQVPRFVTAYPWKQRK